MATYYGAQLVQTGDNEVNIRYDSIGKNSEVFATNDIVGLSSGLLLVATSAIVGVIDKTATMASDNQTVAKVKPGFVPVTDDSIFLMGTNSDLSLTASPGVYYSVTGATGAQQVDVTKGAVTGALRTVEIVKVDPFNEGGTGAGSGLRVCFVRMLKTPYSNVSITS